MFKSAVVLSLLVAVCSAAPSTRFHRLRPHLYGRIVGGEPVEISQYPWQISFQAYDTHTCGGSIISSTWVLSAGHCVYPPSADSYSVRAGTSTRNSGGSVYDVASVIQHDSYDMSTEDYDFAVLQISGSFCFDNNVQTVGLGNSELPGGSAVTTTGWGFLSWGGGEPLQLQAITTSIVERSVCNRAYLGAVTERMICAGGAEGGKAFCGGDSGGPLVEGSTQYGIVSWITECGSTGHPGVYSNVVSVRSWIAELTGV